MICNKNQLTALKKKAREKLEKGFTIAIVGWKDSNHSLFTRRLSNKFVIFFGDSPKELPQKVGLVLFTRFVSHSLVRQIESTKEIHSIVLGTKVIKEVLESIKDLFATCLSSTDTSGGTKPSQESSEVFDPIDMITNVELLDFLTQPRQENVMSSEEQAMSAFQRSFCSEADRHPDGLVGSRAIGAIIKSTGLNKTIPQLVRAGLIFQVRRDGVQKARWYKAGEPMLSALVPDEAVLPETPAGRAEMLLAEEPALLDQRAELEAKIEAINTRLGMIAHLKEVFAQVDQAFGIKTS